MTEGLIKLGMGCEVNVLKRGEDVFFASFSGFLDRSNVNDFSVFLKNEALEGNSAGKVVLGFEGLSYLNSQSIGLLVDLDLKLKAEGRELFLDSPSNSVRDILGAIGVLDLISISEGGWDDLNSKN